MLYLERKGAQNMTFSEKLITLRAGRGWSQEQLAQTLDVTRQAVGRWERSECLPDAPGLTRLARVFDVDPEWLLDDTASGEPKPRTARRVNLAWFDWAMFALTALAAAAVACLWPVVHGNAFRSEVFEILSQLMFLCDFTALPLMWFSLGWSAAAVLSAFGLRPLFLGKRTRTAAVIAGAILPALYVLTIINTHVVALYDWRYTIWVAMNPPILALSGCLFGLVVKRREKR